MTENAAQRIRGSRCVVCNARTTAWYCLDCGVSTTSGGRSDADLTKYRNASAARWQTMRDERTTVANTIGWELHADGIIRSSAPTPVTPSDPRRWCDDCLCYGVHRPGCGLIEMDGRFVGGYERMSPKPKFTRARPLATPEPWWDPRTRRLHDRAVRRRWTLFTEQWSAVALLNLTAALERGLAADKGRPALSAQHSALADPS